MKLFKEVTLDEILFEIDRIFINNLIREQKDKEIVADAIINLSRKSGQSVIRKYFTSNHSCNEFYSEVKKLYRGTWEIREGRKVYTDL